MFGYKVEYDDEKGQVCIIPDPNIPIPHFTKLVKLLGKEGYKWWLPADERRGFLFSKKGGKK